MTYIPLPSLPGVFKDDTPLAAEGFFIDADKMRFVRGKAQTVGGWENATNDLVEGVARGIHTWNSGGILYTAIGTNTHLQIYSDGEIYDITPIVELGTLTDPFSTVDTETTVTVADTAHGLIVGQRVFFANASAVGGLTLNGEFTVTAVPTADTYEIESPVPATSTAGPGGGVVDYDYYLAPGLVDNLGGPGYGIGGYGIGGYGQGATLTEYFSRSWSLDHWVPNLLALPRGGKIFEWAPNFSNTQLVTNGDFASGTGWTTGSGWSVAGGQALATSGMASILSTEIEALPNSYLLIEFDMTQSGGSLDVQVASVDVIENLDATQRVRRIVYTNAGGPVTLGFAKDASFIGTLDNVSVRQMTRAAILPGAPAQNDTMLVTPELIVMVFGTIDADSGLYNPLQVRNSDTGDGDLSANQTWIPAPDNLAFRYTLAQGGRCVAGRLGNGEVIIWTDDAVYRARYTGDTSNVYAYQIIGKGCGLIGVNAAAVLSGVAYWITPAKSFMGYSGGAPTQIPSTVRRYFANNLSPSQQDKIWAFPMEAYGEMWWLYPDIRDGNECSRYIIFNPDPSGPSWTIGTFERTCWIDAVGSQPPMSVSVDGVLYFQETGNSDNGNPLSWSLRSAAMDVTLNGDGGELYQIDFFIPDTQDLMGGYNFTMYAYEYPNSPAVEYGPVLVTSNNTLVDFTPVIARQASFLFESMAAPAFCRFGSPRLDVSKTGMVF